MVVDDEVDVRNSIKEVLEKEGYKVVVAMTADGCRAKVDLEDPDLILMDLMMPGTPPKEILPSLKNYKVVFITVVKKEDAEKEGILDFKNVVGYIEKPFGIKKLPAKVKKFLK